MKPSTLNSLAVVCIACAPFVGCAGNAALQGDNAGASANSKNAGSTTRINPGLNTSLCLDVAGGGQDNGTPVQIAVCSSNEAQQWTIGNDGTVRVFGDKCLDVTNGQTSEGTPLQIWDCTPNDLNQQWLYQNNMLRWTNQNNCLDVPNANASDGVHVMMFGCNGQDAAQQWNAHVAGGGATGATGTTTAPTTTKGSGNYVNLAWADEFDGSSLDVSKWNTEVNCDGGNNNEDECYTASAQNLQFDGQGHLVINVIKEAGLPSGKTYTSGRINSQGKGDFKYGRYEARIQVPSGQGFWPAFWLLPTSSVYGVWPTSGELDIMEILGGDPSLLYGTAHYGAATPYTQSQGQATGENFSQAFHVYAIERDATQVRWYLDDQLFFTLNSTDAAFWPAGYQPSDGTPWPFQQNFFFILNLAMGGNFPGAPDASINQGSMVVDYVHFFQ